MPFAFKAAVTAAGMVEVVMEVEEMQWWRWQWRPVTPFPTIASAKFTIAWYSWRWHAGISHRLSVACTMSNFSMYS